MCVPTNGRRRSTTWLERTSRDWSTTEEPSMTPPPADNATEQPISEAERRPSARIGAILFRHRGWLPVPFLLVPLLARGTSDAMNWILGFVLIFIGEAIRLAGVAAAGTETRRRSRTVHRLVTYGIFAWMRNPLYVGNFLIWLGFIVISGVLWFMRRGVTSQAYGRVCCRR